MGRPTAAVPETGGAREVAQDVGESSSAADVAMLAATHSCCEIFPSFSTIGKHCQSEEPSSPLAYP